MSVPDGFVITENSSNAGSNASAVGTWVPTLTFSDGGTYTFTPDLNYHSGEWSLVGNRVYVSAWLFGTFVNTDAAGYFMVGGLPFVLRNSNLYQQGIAGFYGFGGTPLDPADWPDFTSYGVDVEPGDGGVCIFYPYYFTSNITCPYVTGDNFPAGSQVLNFTFSISYLIQPYF